MYSLQRNRIFFHATKIGLIFAPFPLTSNEDFDKLSFVKMIIHNLVVSSWKTRLIKIHPLVLIVKPKD